MALVMVTWSSVTDTINLVFPLSFRPIFHHQFPIDIDIRTISIWYFTRIVPETLIKPYFMFPSRQSNNMIIDIPYISNK